MNNQIKWPTVSIIITTKNEESNLGRLLTSIQKQTYEFIEVIVVDNNSLDETKKIAKKFTNKVYNYGPERSSQRNFGAKKSHGEYLLFLDADMELSKNVVSECVKKVYNSDIKILTIAETTVGDGIIAKVRRFEREMYMNEPKYEVSRFFERNIFFEFDGYDVNLTGPEDYDLPFRMSQKYRSGRINRYIFHHEENVTLGILLKKKFYYAGQGASYARKHPKLVWVQGTILFRGVYLKNWFKFIKSPVVGFAFIVIRFLETVWAFAGFLRNVGIKGLISVMIKSFK